MFLMTGLKKRADRDVVEGLNYTKVSDEILY